MQRRLTPDEWRLALRTAKPEVQALNLRGVNHEQLGITPREYLELLESVEVHIRDEPALSIYWQIRGDLEQALRQERRG